MVQARLLSLTEDIYDAAAGGTPWAAVGQSLAALVHARSASLMVNDPASGAAELLCHANIPVEAVAAYAGQYWRHDLWTQRAADQMHASNGTRVWSSGHLVPDAEFLRSEFWNGFGRHYGLRFVVGTVVPLGAAGTMPLGLHRPQGAAPFDETEKRLVEAVLPHLRRALQLRHRLAVAPAGRGAPKYGVGLAALDALPTAAFVVDDRLHVQIANAAAELLATAGLGLRMVREDGQPQSRAVLRACHRSETERLASLVAATALNGASGGALRLRAADGTVTAAALVAPLPARLLDAPISFNGRIPGRALVMLRPIAAAAPPRAELLRDLFGLTAAEAEVARALTGGATKGEVAGARGLRETTVRTQVRAVLAKTGAVNLRDLERMLAGLVGM